MKPDMVARRFMNRWIWDGQVDEKMGVNAINIIVKIKSRWIWNWMDGQVDEKMSVYSVNRYIVKIKWWLAK